ncbi:hypothetical protein C8R45DRAFT_1077734 [Mycena sanguinolenta]|nr:hypothetical protein C8R45DRAFT_1077734 [Mycena sanguinolenta]
MTHGHMIVRCLATGKVSEEWDYDLIGASGYIIAAAVDLILKSGSVAQLGDAASESPLLPALLCAERVVSIGTGSSLFTILTALGFVRGPAGRRRAAIAIIPLTFALVASWFTLRAHQAIFLTAPVIWCRIHYARTLKKGDATLLFRAVDFPASLADVITLVPDIYTSRTYWVLAGAVSAVVIVIALLEMIDAADLCVIALAIVLPAAALLPLIAVAFLSIVWILTWLGLWVVCWVPIYILAFFPKMGDFPLTNMSVTDMDQLATLLGVGFIAAFRSGRRIFKALQNRVDPSSSTHELQLLNEP